MQHVTGYHKAEEKRSLLQSELPGLHADCHSHMYGAEPYFLNCFGMLGPHLGLHLWGEIKPPCHRRPNIQVNTCSCRCFLNPSQS